MLLKISIVALLILPIFAFYMDNRGEKKEEVFEGTLFVSKEYTNILHICALLSASALIVICFMNHFQMIAPYFIVFATLVLFCEYLVLGMSRNKVIIKENSLLITPVIGKTKEVDFIEITGCERKRNIGLRIYVGEKKVATISCDMIGYQELLDLLKEKEILDDEEE